MSTILPSLQAPAGRPSIPEEAVASAEQAAPAQVNYTPLWLVGNGTSRSALEFMGIRMPSANGDVAALLAQVSFKLEQTVGEIRKNDVRSAMANLAAALVSFSVQAARDESEYRRITLENGEAALADVQDKVGPLKGERDGQNATIESSQREIASLLVMLATPDLDDATRQRLLGYLGAARQTLDTALAARESIDLRLADARIESLERQVADLEARLASTEPDSQEYVNVVGMRASVNGQLTTARDEVRDFLAGPKTEANRTAFSNSNLAASDTMMAGLSAEVGGFRADFAGAIVTLVAAEELTTSIALSSNASLRESRSRALSDNSARDNAVERAFEEVLAELDRTGVDTLSMSKSIDIHLDQVRRQDIMSAALGILGAMADVAGALADLQEENLSRMTIPPASVVASRFRMEV